MAAPDGTLPIASEASRVLWPRVLAVAVAGATFLLAFANGAYATDRRTGFGLVVWWAVMIVAIVGANGFRRSRPALLLCAGLAGFAVWTIASTGWASDGEAAYAEFTRVALYLGLVVLVVALARRESAGHWADGLALGIAAIAATALASRLYPDAVGSSAGISTLPFLRSRLSYPLGYWNGLGIFTALGVPLVLSSALRARAPVVRALFVAAVPILAATMYLTSSRGAFVTAVVGLVAFVAIADRRWSAAGTALVAVLGAAVAIGVVSSRAELVNGTRGGLGSAQARSAAVWLALVVVCTCVAYLAALSLRPPRSVPTPVFGRIVVSVAAVAVLLVVVFSHPVRRFDEFRQAPTAAAVKGNFVPSHLLSASGSGRWQFWTAAVDEFRARPVVGGGAGSFSEWWPQHGSLTASVQDAHSLYLETLGELGIVGFVLVLLVMASGLVAVVHVARSRVGAERTVVAGAGAAFCGFVVAAAIDWMWEMTVVAAVAFVCIALVVALGERGEAPRGSTRRRVFGARIFVVAVALCIAAAQGVELLAQIEIERSQSAARRGDSQAALDHARAAVRVQPWAATPLTQLALVDEQAGALGSARIAIERAVARDPNGWKLHLIAARIALESGDISAARRSFDRARMLNPRSPLFG